MVACWFTIFGQGTVTTFPPLINDNGSTGVTFEVQSSAPAVITDIKNLFNSGTIPVEVWYRIGGVKHSAGNPSVTAANGWVQHFVGPVVGNGTSPVSITGWTNLTIPAGQRVGFAIVGGLSYQSWVASGQDTFTDNTLTIYTGQGIGYGGAGTWTFHPRQFLGSVTYALSYVGSCANAFSDFKIDSISGTSAKVDWIPGSGNTSFYVEYGVTGFTPGGSGGTKITGTLPGGQPPVILTGLSPNTTYDVYFGEICNSGSDSIYFPNPQVFTTTKICSPPFNLSTANTTSNSTQVSWGYSGAANGFELIYGPVGFNPASSGVSSVVGSSPQTISSLTPNTSYDLYIIANCGVTNGLSDTIGPVNFRTTCVIASAPFSENFDGADWVAGSSGQNSNSAISPCWSRSPDLAVPSVFQMGPYNTNPGSGNGPTTDMTGGNFVYGEASYGASGNIANLTSPPIDVSGLTTPALYFFQHRYSGGNIADMSIEVSNDFGTTWNTEYTVTGDIQSSLSDPWVLEFVNLSSYTGDTVMLRFVQVSKGCCGDAAIDSVVVDEAPTCPWPVNLSVSGVTDSSAIAHWSDPSGTKWDIFWGPAGFQQGSPGTFNMTTSSKPDTLAGLLPNTEYDFYVRTNCLDSASGVSILTGPFTFRTACSPFSAPYADNFDSYPTNITPYCWTLTQTGGRTTVGQAYTYAFGSPSSPPNNIYFYNGNPAGPADTTLFVSPRFSDMVSSDKRIQFTAKSSFGNNTLIVGTMADPKDMLSFNVIDTVSLSETNSFFVINLDAANGYNGTDNYVAFRHGNAGTFTLIFIDDFVYEEIPACSYPFLHTLGVDAGITTANVYWGSGTAGDESHYEVGPVGFVPGTNSFVFADSVAGSVDTGMVTGLTAQTTYEFYMRDSCAVNGFSPWIGPFTFTTQCVSAAMPYYESFDLWPLSCWDMTGGTQNWVEYVGTSGSHAEASFWNFPTGESMVMTSRPVTLSRDAQIRFYWSHEYQSFYPDDELMVRAKILGGRWDTLLILKGPVDFHDPTASATAPGSFVEEEILLDALVYTGHDVVVELRANSGYGPNLYVNDFYIEDAPLCPNVANLSAGNVTDSSAMLSWMGNPNAASYEIWFGPQGFFQGTATVGGVRSMVSSPGLLVDTLSDNSCYEFLVRGICGPGDTSLWIGPEAFCTPCLPFTAPYQESFDTWPLGCWDLSGSQTWTNFAGPGTDQYALANFWLWSSGEAFMTSPIINLNAQQAEVEFEWSHLYDAFYPDNQILVIVNKVGTSIKDTILNLKGPGNFNDPTAGNTSPGNFIKENLLLDSATYANSSIRVTFQAITDWGSDAYINNFKVKYPVSQDVQLLSGRFERNGKCLTNNDTIVLEAKNLLGSAINFATDPLVANYSVTGPINTSGTITVNTGTLPSGDTISMMATNIDMSQPGVYTLDAYINPNSTNLDGLNDTLYSSVTYTVYDDWSVSPDTVVIITNTTDTVELEAKSPFLSGGDFFFSEVSHYYGFGSNPGTKPPYLLADDYIEITGVPNSDLGGLVLEQWNTTSLINTYTFPAGTLIGPNGTAIIAVGQLGTSVPSPSDFYYHADGSSTFSSGIDAGRILKDAGNNIIDAVGYGPAFAFPAAAGVSAADWSGNTGVTSGTAGIRLIAPDNNTASSWAVVSATAPQDANVLNPNINVPSAGAISGFDWTFNSAVIDTLPKTVVGPYTTSGIYNYIATFNSPCGLFSDTVTVIVNLPGGCPIPTNLAANVIACDSVELSWNSAADSAIVAYVPTGGTPGTGSLVIGDSSLTITGTSANTTYDYYVSNICKGDTGSVAGPFTFSTGNTGAPVAVCALQQQGFSLLVNFDASASTGDRNIYTWDFGDGSTASGVNATHTYGSGGAKTVTLVVTNACGTDTTTCTLPATFSYGDNVLAQSLVLFPNPAKDQVKVSFDAGATEMTLRVLDLSGKEIMLEEHDNLSGKVDLIINLEELADGVYMVEISNGELKARKRLVKQ